MYGLLSLPFAIIFVFCSNLVSWVDAVARCRRLPLVMFYRRIGFVFALRALLTVVAGLGVLLPGAENVFCCAWLSIGELAALLVY